MIASHNDKHDVQRLRRVARRLGFDLTTFGTPAGRVIAIIDANRIIVTAVGLDAAARQIARLAA